jgi:hypothetical protein
VSFWALQELPEEQTRYSASGRTNEFLLAHGFVMRQNDAEEQMFSAATPEEAVFGRVLSLPSLLFSPD